MRLSDIVFYNRGQGPDQGNNYWRRVTAPHFTYVCAALAVVSLGLGLGSLWAVTARGSVTSVAFSQFWERPALLLLNAAPCALLALCLFFATGRAWAACLLTGLAVLAAALARDLPLFAEWGFPRMLWVYGNVYPQMLVIPAMTLAGTLLCRFLMPGVLRGRAPRLAGAFLTALTAAVVLLTVYTSPALYASQCVPSASDPALARGFLYPLLYALMGGR